MGSVAGHVETSELSTITSPVIDKPRVGLPTEKFRLAFCPARLTHKQKVTVLDNDSFQETAQQRVREILAMRIKPFFCDYPGIFHSSLD